MRHRAHQGRQGLANSASILGSQKWSWSLRSLFGVEPPPRVGAPLGSIAGGPTAGEAVRRGQALLPTHQALCQALHQTLALAMSFAALNPRMVPPLPPLWLGDAQQEPHQLVPQTASSSARLAARGAWLEDHLPLASRCLGRCGRAHGGGEEREAVLGGIEGWVKGFIPSNSSEGLFHKHTRPQHLWTPTAWRENS